MKSTAIRTKKPKGNREWVKNAIIIFLAVMLILTFFSNTIMNYSLPEVAAQYPVSTTITTKIRGSGVVEAAQTYNVTLDETRQVASVEVKEGDTVDKGQTLLVLEATESQELQDARDAYNALKLEYDKATLEKGDANNAANLSMQQLRDAVSKAESDLSEAQTVESNIKWYQDAEASAKKNVTAKNTAATNAQNTVESLENQISNVENSNAEYLSAKKRYEENPTEENLAEVTRIYEEQIAPQIASLTQKLSSAQQTRDSAKAEAANAEAAYAAAQDATAAYQSAHADAMSVSSAKAALQAAKDALASAEATAADEKVQQEYDNAVAALDLKAQEEALKEAEKKVEELEKKASATKIVSGHKGVVTQVNVAAGSSTTPDEPLMVVELTDRGYTLTASVTKEQARSLSTGLKAEITNLWDTDIEMILTNIAADKSNPTGGKILTFTLSGEDITVGQSISFSVGNKNASYDVVIPTAAIHTDADGSFVYTVSAKSSPLGNRYTVKKKSVTVLASDEVNSAVSGDLSTADFVITTSTTPLEVGDQIRIAQ